MHIYYSLFNLLCYDCKVLESTLMSKQWILLELYLWGSFLEVRFWLFAFSQARYQSACLSTASRMCVMPFNLHQADVWEMVLYTCMLSSCSLCCKSFKSLLVFSILTWRVGFSLEMILSVLFLSPPYFSVLHLKPLLLCFPPSQAYSGRWVEKTVGIWFLPLVTGNLRVLTSSLSYYCWRQCGKECEPCVVFFALYIGFMLWGECEW